MTKDRRPARSARSGRRGPRGQRPSIFVHSGKKKVTPRSRPATSPSPAAVYPAIEKGGRPPRWPRPRCGRFSARPCWWPSMTRPTPDWHRVRSAPCGQLGVLPRWSAKASAHWLRWATRSPRDRHGVARECLRYDSRCGQRGIHGHAIPSSASTRRSRSRERQVLSEKEVAPSWCACRGSEDGLRREVQDEPSLRRHRAAPRVAGASCG